MKNLTFILLVALIFLNLACSKTNNDPVDKDKPTFVVKSYDKEIDISKGAAFLNFEIEFTDNVNLGSFKLEIHDNFDGHGHGRTEATKLSFDKVYTLSGTKFTVKDRIPVSADAATGAYDIVIMFFDAAGNEGEQSVLGMNIVNALKQPTISVTEPNLPSSMKKGGKFNLKAKVSDPDDNLATITVSIAEESKDGRVEEDKPPVVVFERKFENINSRTFDLNTEISLASSLKAGGYSLQIKAFDKAGNLKSFEGDITITE